MEQSKQNDSVKSPIIQEIIMSNRIGDISETIAQKTGISPTKAIEMFYASKTCANLHDRTTGLYLYSNLYIVDDFMLEMTSDKQNFFTKTTK